MGEDVALELAHPSVLVRPLLLLLLAEEPVHGYVLAERLKPLGFEWSSPGPVYQQLRRLEDIGLVGSSWPPVDAGPMPRLYELTSAGRDALDRCANSVGELVSMLSGYLDRYEALDDP